MRRRRTLPLLLTGLAVLVPAVAAGAPAQAQAPDPGVGTSTGATELLALRIGDGALDVRVGVESSSTSNDPATGTSATERITPLVVSSSLVPALGALSIPPVDVTSTDGERSTATPGVDLGALTSAAPVPGVLGGVIEPTTLRALVDATGAIADAAGGVTNLSVLGGVLRLGELDAVLGSDAVVTGAGAGRSLTLDRLEVLDLDAVLQLLGIDLGALPLGVAAGLLQQLGFGLPGGATSPAALVSTVEGLLAQAGSVPAQIDALGDQVVALQAQLAPLLPFVGCNPVLSLLPLVGGLTCAALVPLATSLQSQIAALTAQIDALTDSVAALLQPVLDVVGGLLSGLGAAPLLVVEDLSVGVVADAVDTVEGSTADVTGSVGAVRVGALTLPGADLLSLAQQATDAVGDVLSVVDPVLGDLVDVSLFEETTSVAAEGAQTVASAAVTALRVAITPPDVCALLGRLGAGAATSTIAGVLGTVGQPLSALPLPVADVLGALGSTLSCSTSALTQPLELEVLKVSGRGAFAAVPTQVPPTTAPGTPRQAEPLPRTGGEVPLALAGAALAAAVLVRRAVARP
jgi:hypothetical protein